MYTIEQLKTQDFSQILQEIHDKMKDKINKRKNDKKAEEIEKFLKEIKKTVKILSENKTKKLTIEKGIDQELVNLIQQTLDMRLGKDTDITSTKLFGNRSKEIQAFNADDIFEEELSFLIKAATKMKKINLTSEILIGGKSGSTQAMNTQFIKKFQEEIGGSIIDITNDALKEQAKKYNSLKNKQIKKISARAIKSDIAIPKLEITGSLNKGDKIDKFLKLISGESFTLKNYQSYKEDTNTFKTLSRIDIHLGNTNPYKAITGTLSEIYKNVKAQQRIYYRGMIILAGKDKNEKTATPEKVDAHFSHLKFIYELQGTGLIDKKSGKNIKAKYIIWNDPDTERVIVRSTDTIIKMYWQKYNKNVFGDFSISGSKLSKAK